jgi:hypothetical protein
MSDIRDRVEDSIRKLQKDVAYGLPSTWGDVSVEGRACSEDFRRWYEQLERIERDASVLRQSMFKIWIEEERKEEKNV